MKIKKTKNIVEVCPHCDHEAKFKGVKLEAQYGSCPQCGKLVHFCDECMYNHDDNCNPMDPTSYCHKHYTKEPMGWKEYEED